MITRDLKPRDCPWSVYHLDQIKYDFVAPDNTLWNIKAIVGNTVQLQTVSAWGSFYYRAVNVYEFRQNWKEHKP